jgi:capsule biosynthesis phosphatase
MIKDGAMVIPYLVDDFYCLGTPQQLKTYCSKYNMSPKRFCFDLDGTLVTFPESPGDYQSVRPIVRNIRFVQYLHEQGHTIIIQTARKMLSSHHNSGQAAQAAHGDVFATLEKYKIPFDEIYFGKPYAHFYIDDLSVKPINLERETGFYNTHVEARHFNRIEYQGEYVIKTTSNPGEVYWYRHVPEAVREHFPQAQIDGNLLTLERIDGIVFSYLIVNNSLTRQNIGNLLETVGRLHASAPVPDVQIDYNANYIAKMWERYQDFDYRSISNDAKCYYKKISERIAGRTPILGVIHGDLVFSNIFLCDHQRIRFIDMRGQVGDVETIFGDVFYDYAKIYQSLLGYDFIHNDCEINETYLGGLRSYFEEAFVHMFYTTQLETLKMITACLLFSLIPLHRDPAKQKKYFGLIERCL